VPNRRSIEFSTYTTGGDDIVSCEVLRDGSVLAIVADGATGVGHGHLAAQVFVETIRRRVTSWTERLEDAFFQADAAIARGPQECDTTGIVLLAKDGRFTLASVGDSEAWMLATTGPKELTRQQWRKPRIGSGIRTPEHNVGALDGPVLLGSDGLFMLGRGPKLLQSASAARRAPRLVQELIALNGGAFDDTCAICIGFQ